MFIEAFPASGIKGTKLNMGLIQNRKFACCDHCATVARSYAKMGMTRMLALE